MRLPNMVSGRWVLLVMCLVLGLGHPAGAEGLPTGRDIITVPYETTRSGLLLVAVTLNKTTHVKFLLDTGTSQCFLSEALADRLQLARAPATLANGKPNLNNGVPFDKVQVDDMAMGSFHVTGDFGVMEKKHFDLEQDGAEGMIGVNVLSDKAVALYPAQHLLYLYATGGLSAGEALIAGFGPTAHTAPLIRDPTTGVYRCPVTVAGPHGVSDDTPVLDTGADRTNVAATAADAAGLVPIGTSTSTMFNRRYENSVARVLFLKLGDLQVFDLPVNFTHVTPEPNRSLGMDVLGSGSILIDFAASKLYLSRPSSAPVKPRP